MKKVLIGIIAIVLIGAVVVGFYNYKESDNLDKDDSLDIKDEVKDEAREDDGDVVVQFDRVFYELEDISKEHAKSKTLKDTVDFNYDLDGDLVKDKISFYKKSDYVYAVKLNDVEVLVNEYNPQIYIVDLNESDDILDVVLYDEGPSGDPHYTVYSKKGNNLESLYDKKGDSLKCDRKGTVLVDDSKFETFSPELYFDYAYINNGVLVNKKIDLETISDIEFKNDKFYFSEDYDNKNKIGDIDLDPSRVSEIGIEKLNDDVSFKILGFEYIDNNGYKDEKIEVKLSDGRSGYIFMLYFAG